MTAEALANTGVMLPPAGRRPLVLGWMRGYRREWLGADTVAGLTTAAVVIPKALAYGAVAALPVVMGLGTAFVPAVLYALFGASRALSVSTTGAIAIMSATALAPFGAHPAQAAGAAVVLAILVGGILLLAGLLRLGFLGNFISDPVLTGVKAGIGLVLIVDQAPTLLGLHIGAGSFPGKLQAIARHLTETSGPTVLLAVVTLAVIVALERWAPKIPGPLAAVVLGVAASGLLHLDRLGVGVVGSVPAGIPLPALPDLKPGLGLWPAALGIALMAFTETIAAGRAFVRPGDPRPDANRELVALGTSNLGAGLFGCMPSGGGMSQTAVNAAAGARSQVAGLVTATVVAATLVFLAPLIGVMPQATLAAVVVVTSIGLLSLSEFRAIAEFRGAEFRWALAALAGVVLLGTLKGVFLAVSFSLIGLMWHANHPPVYALRRKPGTNVFRPVSDEHPDDEPVPGMLIARTEGRMTFASAPRAGERLWELLLAERPRVLLLDCSAVPDFEYSALRMLEKLEGALSRSGVTLWIAALNPEPLRVIGRTAFGRTLGENRLFVTVEQAVSAWTAARQPAGATA
jgi:high affinity sulfate transporter 1